MAVRLRDPHGSPYFSGERFYLLIEAIDENEGKCANFIAYLFGIALMGFGSIVPT